jgi:hypothetical protein
MTNEYAERAVHAVENLDTKTSSALAVGGIKAVTYALLDLAAAIRQHV